VARCLPDASIGDIGAALKTLVGPDADSFPAGTVSRLPEHLPRVERVIEPDSIVCP
jgi:hypothetical protein